MIGILHSFDHLPDNFENLRGLFSFLDHEQNENEHGSTRSSFRRSVDSGNSNTDSFSSNSSTSSISSDERNNNSVDDNDDARALVALLGNTGTPASESFASLRYSSNSESDKDSDKETTTKLQEPYCTLCYNTPEVTRL